MKVKLLVLLIMIIPSYAILPSIYFRYLSPSVKRKFDDDGIYLTFDDGPNPDYTLEVLDILREYNVKATFFVIAEKAKAHKDIIDRINKEGHTLAIHSYSHKGAWRLSPIQTKEEIKNSIIAIENLGYEVKYFRPPWGVFNFFTQYYLNKYGLQSIFWSIITRDWDPKASVDNTVNRIVNNIEFGDIIVLHDSNHKHDSDTRAPLNTIKALKSVLPTLLDRGYVFKTIDEYDNSIRKVG